MKPRVSVFIATSLDGYISRPDGSIDWLDRANATMSPGEDCGFKAFFASVDVLVLGRNTYEQMLTFPEWFYGDKPVIVLTSRPLEVPARLAGLVEVSGESPAALVDRLGAAGVRHLYVDGGVTIQRFLQAGLVDHLTVTLIPVLLGAGRPLFGPLAGDVLLRHRHVQAYPFGFVQVTYDVERAAAE